MTEDAGKEHQPLRTLTPGITVIAEGLPLQDCNRSQQSDPDHRERLDRPDHRQFGAASVFGPRGAPCSDTAYALHDFPNRGGLQEQFKVFEGVTTDDGKL